MAGEADSADMRLSTSRASGNPEPCADDGLAFILGTLIFMVFDRHEEQPPFRWMYSPNSERYLHTFSYVLIATVMGTSFLPTAAAAATHDVQSPVESIAALASSTLMLRVAEGPFIMGTTRANHEPFSFDLQYDDTEQPQRRVWLHQYEIDRDEVSLGEYLLWLQQQQRHLPEEMRKLIDHVTTIHAMQPETLARWPALYVTWSEASDFCHARDKRLPTEAEWEKAARGESGNLFPWGQRPPTPALAMFGQYHAHEIPIVASVDSGADGREPLWSASYGGKCSRVGRRLVWDRLLCDHA